ncbi:MAG: GtrA family protein [Blautia sp.]|nr:GtrA family protein [Blautia sp.]
MHLKIQNVIDQIKNNISFLKFCIVGGISTFLDLGIYLLLYDGAGVVLSKIVSMGCSMVFSYNLNKKWSFSISTKRTKKEVGRYLVTQAINMTVNVGVNYIVLEIFQIKLFAFIVATLVAMTINYVLQKRWVFRGEK